MARLAESDSPPFRLGLLVGGMTAVLVGYFAVWLPGPAAGLRLIGLELGEWIKFLGVGFGAQSVLLAADPAWSDYGSALGRLDQRPMADVGISGLALLVSLLAFPAVAAITMEPRSEWLVRITAIGLVPSYDRSGKCGFFFAPGRSVGLVACPDSRSSGDSAAAVAICSHPARRYARFCVDLLVLV